MGTTLAIIITTIGVVLATLIPTFIINNKKKTSGEDWAIASRELPLFVVVGTQFASVIGGGVLVGHLGNAYTNGIGVAIYGIIMVMPFIVLMYLANWLRNNQFSTIPEIFKSFTGNSKAITVLAAVMTMLFPFGWITSQITAFGSIYSTLTGLDYNMLCIIFALVSLFFIMPAGLKTVAWTDFIFACFMGLMLIATLVYGTSMAGGWSEISSKVDPANLTLSGSVGKIGLSTVFLWVFAILPGGMTNQLYYQRICAINDGKKVNKSLLISAIVSFVGFCWAVYMGITISSINPNIEGSVATGWFMGELPTPLLAGFAALIFATMMSTVSSGVQSIVVNVTRDIMPSVKSDYTEEKSLKLSRILSLVVIVFSLIMCLVFTDTLTWLVATAGFSAATLLCPIFVGYAMKDKNFITNQGIVASMIFGAIGGAIGMILKTAINYAAIGILFSFIALISVSALTKKQKQ